MNKKILTVAAAMTAASAFGFVTWHGADGVYKIDTELDQANENGGYWFTYGDDADGGASKVEWPVTPGNKYSDDALDPIIDHCGGVCGTFTLGKGTLTYDPFVGIGFNLAGVPEGSTAADVADASAMGGVCISYTVDVAATLELGLGDAGDQAIGYDNPSAPLAKSTTAKKANLEWSKFKQAGWGTGKITGAEAAAKLAAIKFKIQAKDGTTGSFNIMGVGSYVDGDCDGSPVPPDAIGAKALQSSLKAQLSGRTLDFGKSVAKAEIVNLQGQVVMAASSVKSMDLSKLQAGVYMVRAMGLSQQIMLK